MATNSIEIRLVNAGGVPTPPSPTPPPPSGNGAPPPPAAPGPATLPFPGRPTAPPGPPPNPGGPATLPMPAPGAPPRFGPQSYPIPAPTPTTPPRFGPQSGPPGSPNARAIPVTPPAPTPFRAGLDALFDKERDARHKLIDDLVQERKERLIRFREMEEEARRQMRQEAALRLAGTLAAISQALNAVNNYVNAQIAISSQRIRGQNQEAAIAETQATAGALADAAPLVGAAIGSIIPGVGTIIGGVVGAGVSQVVRGIGDLFTASERAFLERSKAFDELINRQAQLSPEVATAKAMREINQFRLDMREAEALGPDLARLEEAKARLDSVNAIKTLNYNIEALAKQIEDTNEKADKEIEWLESLVAAAEGLGIVTKEQIDQQKKLIAEMKKARDGTPDFGPTNDLLKAGRIMGGTFAQGRVVDRTAGAMGTPLLTDFRD
jgi:hypothetical protein